jgi:hypothetical protein
MKNIIAILFLVFGLFCSTACNKPDAAAIVAGKYTFTPNSAYTAYRYNIVADTFQLTKLFDQFFFDAPYPTVELKRISRDEVSLHQFVPGDTMTITGIELTLDGGGTLLRSSIKNGKYISGSVIAYELKYDIIDTVKKELVRITGVEPAKK